MRVSSLTVHQFGPLEGCTMQFAPGMTVVYGPNESAKSTWHAALYAAICGRRRTRGPGGREDQRFSDRHRPWDGGGWAVSAVVQLPDGREVELHQDLAAKVGSYARDVATGRDCTSEVLADGAVDGTRWLGLERRSFAGLAWTPQAQVMALASNVEPVTSLIQRSMGGGEGDRSAAEALSRIAAFRSESVGSDRRGSTKPLRRAVEQVDSARARLAELRDEASTLDGAAAELELLRSRASTAARRLQEHQSAREADMRAASAELDAARAALTLHREMPAAAAPDGGGDDRPPPAQRSGAVPALVVVLVLAVVLVVAGALAARFVGPAGPWIAGSLLLLTMAGVAYVSVVAAVRKRSRRPASPAESDDLLAEREAARRAVEEELARRVDQASLMLAEATGKAPLEEEPLQGRPPVVERLRTEAAAAAEQAARAEGAYRLRRSRLGSIAEAEEDLHQAEERLTALRRVDATLALTSDFVRRAADHAHRQVAPLLGSTLRQWIGPLTQDRYTDATVDPASLEVRLLGSSGKWRPADRLSVGTAEQVYLLLRLALLDHLSSGAQVPLFLDEVTVHADARRTGQLLELLAESSAERQVVLFTQEAAVLDWAVASLSDPRHSVVRLAPLGRA